MTTTVSLDVKPRINLTIKDLSVGDTFILQGVTRDVYERAMVEDWIYIISERDCDKSGILCYCYNRNRNYHFFPDTKVVKVSVKITGSIDRTGE